MYTIVAQIQTDLCRADSSSAKDLPNAAKFPWTSEFELDAQK